LLSSLGDAAALSGMALLVALSAAQAGPLLNDFVRPVVRRIVVLTDDDTDALPRCIARGTDIEIADVIRLNGRSNLNTVAKQLDVDELRRNRIWCIVVASRDQKCLPVELLLRCRFHDIPVLSEAAFWEQETWRIKVDAGDASWFLGGQGFRHTRIERIGKRLFDLSVAVALLLFTLPLTLLVALLIRCDSRGPIFYLQQRVGLSGRTFTMYKFRSMVEDAEIAGQPIWASERDPRITRVGKFIRYTRIDELPQLLNVLRGDMSIIGPRPERPYFVKQLAETIPLYDTRHWIKPGITGWAQVNASYTDSVQGAREKLELDLYYLKNRSIFLDLLILVRTFRVVLLQQGAR